MANEKRLIDADEVLEVLCNWCPPNVPCPVGGCAEYQRIRKMLTDDAVEVVHGRWHEVDGETEWECYYRCSKCFSRSYVLTNYCPDCGAKMDGDGNE